MTRVKICGLRQVEHAVVALEAGADFLGLVFAPSRRRIGPEAAQELVAEIKRRREATVVGVFVNTPAEEINRIAGMCRLDYAQLSGDEPDEIVQALDLPAIQVFHVPPEGLDARLAQAVEESAAELVMLDRAAGDSYGGTGRSFAWTAGVRPERPFLLAGGLREENAADAVRAMRPWGLDVSSGVETDGEKDPAKIRRFLAGVKAIPVQ